MTTTANIDFTGHAAEMAAIASQEAEILASQEYLNVLRGELAEEQARLSGGLEQEEDAFGGFFAPQTEAQWTEARLGRISQLKQAIARHPLA